MSPTAKRITLHITYYRKNSVVKSWNKSRRAPILSWWVESRWVGSPTRNRGFVLNCHVKFRAQSFTSISCMRERERERDDCKKVEINLYSRFHIMKHRCYYLHCWFATRTKCENNRSTVGSSAKLTTSTACIRWLRINMCMGGTSVHQ